MFELHSCEHPDFKTKRVVAVKNPSSSAESRKSNANIAQYTALIRVAGMRIPDSVLKLFRLAASGATSHDDLRNEYLKNADIKRDR